VNRKTAWGNLKTLMSVSSLIVCRTAYRLMLAVALLSASSLFAAPVSGYKVMARYPHSTESYTEGFFYLDGLFYEGTGLKGHSAVMAIQPETGKPLQQLDLPAQYFGEGIVNWGANLYEWTWQSHVCFVYDRFSLHHQTVQLHRGGLGHDTHRERDHHQRRHLDAPIP